MIFKKNMAFTKLVPDEVSGITIEVLVDGLNVNIFENKGDLMPLQQGFVSAEDPFGDNFDFSNLEAFDGLWVCFAFRRETKRADSAAVAREMGDTSGMSRDQKQNKKYALTQKYLQRAVPRVTVTPIFLNMETCEAIVFSASSKIIDEAQSLLTFATGKNYQEEECDSRLLTFMWWDTETNTFRDTPFKTWVDKTVVVASEDGKVSASGSIEEARIAVSKGGLVAKADFVFEGEKGSRDCTLTSNGRFSKLTFPKEYFAKSNQYDLYGTMCLILSEVQEARKMLAFWAHTFWEANREDKGMTPKIMEVWGKGDFCSRQFDDI